VAGDGVDDAISAALDAAQVAADAVRGITDDQEHITRAKPLADGLRVIYEDVARQRLDRAVRIHDRESLSLAQLADRVSISKARADQIVRAARRRDAAEDEENGDA